MSFRSGQQNRTNFFQVSDSTLEPAMNYLEVDLWRNSLPEQFWRLENVQHKAQLSKQRHQSLVLINLRCFGDWSLQWTVEWKTRWLFLIFLENSMSVQMRSPAVFGQHISGRSSCLHTKGFFLWVCGKTTRMLGSIVNCVVPCCPQLDVEIMDQEVNLCAFLFGILGEQKQYKNFFLKQQLLKIAWTEQKCCGGGGP